VQVKDPDSKRWLMFYEGVAVDGARSICLATSADGARDWQPCDQPVLAPSADASAWDAGSVGAPCAVAMSAGRWRLYYAGKAGAAGGWGGIGLALSPEGQQLAAAGKAGVQFKRRTGRKAAAEEAGQ
jgi:hypothetical protein